MSKEKNIVISYELFRKILIYFNTENVDPNLEEEIKQGIHEKMTKLANRERYQNAMLGKTDQERRELLQLYYDNKKGIPLQ